MLEFLQTYSVQIFNHSVSGPSGKKVAINNYSLFTSEFV